VGDINIAHKEIDLENWKSNRQNSGFLPEALLRSRTGDGRVRPRAVRDAARRVIVARESVTGGTTVTL
jgi:exonuclease III